jgi:hypothetical protein
MIINEEFDDFVDKIESVMMALWKHYKLENSVLQA